MCNELVHPQADSRWTGRWSRSPSQSQRAPLLISLTCTGEGGTGQQVGKAWASVTRDALILCLTRRNAGPQLPQPSTFASQRWAACLLLCSLHPIQGARGEQEGSEVRRSGISSLGSVPHDSRRLGRAWTSTQDSWIPVRCLARCLCCALCKSPQVFLNEQRKK